MRNFAETPSKKTENAARKTKDAAIVAEKAAEEVNKDLNEVKSLSADDLEKVSGGGDPFSGIPRIEPEPIDDELRKNG